MKLITIVISSFALAAAFIIPEESFIKEYEEPTKADELPEAFRGKTPKEVQEDAKLLVPELVQKYGYPCEKHTVITPDGYILEVHRIPHGIDGSTGNRPIVALQHGLQSSSADWVIPGPGHALPYLLADAGYDVWMLNARGNRYSRKHIQLDPNKNGREFFSFTWHEIATLDLPEVIDYALALTGQEKLFYIGHSQGTTVSYILCSEKPEYNDKLRAVFSFAPTAYLTHMQSPLRLLAPHIKVIQIMFNILGIYETTATNDVVAELGDLFCSDNGISQTACVNIVFAMFGFNPEQLNATMLPVILGHTPAGASWRQTFHYGQVFNSGKFRQWDYGLKGNQKQYGSDEPPEYNLQNIRAPFHMFYSTNDKLGNATDVLKLHEELRTSKLYLVPDSKFNHMDYLYAIDAPRLLYENVINIMTLH